MTSVVAISNMGLSNIGKQRINALTDPEPEARAANQFYLPTLRTMLSKYNYRWAGQTVPLAEVPNDKPGKWRKAYDRPTGCLKIRWLRPEYSEDDPCSMSDHEEMRIPYDAEGGKIYCNLPFAFLRGTFMVTDPTKLPPLFVDAFSWHLSARFAMPLTRDPKIRADCYQVALTLEAQAQEADANDVRETSDYESDFVEARNS